MVDYYSILAQGVLGLAINNTQSRHQLYEHARTVVIEYLQTQDQQLSTLESIAEKIALEGAIMRLEAELRSPRTSSPKVAPLPDADAIPDFASLLRQPAEGGPPPDLLIL